MSVEVDQDDIQAFLIESEENLSQIEQHILHLEQAPTDAESLTQIYRSLHSVKGNCGFLPFPKLEAIAHAGESLLGALRDRKLHYSSAIATVLLQTVDEIRQLLQTIASTNGEGEKDYAPLIATLESAQSGVAIAQVQQEVPSAPLTESASTVRVNIDLLDRVLNLVEELVLARNQVVQFSSLHEDATFAGVTQRLSSITSELQEGVMQTRMQPVATLFQKFPRVVRDLAIASGKQVQIAIEGSETELDRSILETIKDPLTHLIRNCIDHGIEAPNVRLAQGKPPEGLLSIRAFHEHGKVNLEIRDDGQGIDPERLKQRSQQLGLLNAAQAEALSQREAFDLMFLPGFSTAEKVTNLSGRGVGMDVVRSNLEKVNGTIDVQSQVGVGSTFRIRIPLTLAIIPALLVQSAGTSFAIAQANIRELVRLENEAMQSIETLYDVPVYRLRETLLPLVNLNTVLALPEASQDAINIVVIQADEYQFGLVVDAIDDIQEIVVKPLGQQLRNIHVYAGATILGDGQIALILDAVGLAHQAGVMTQLQKRLTVLPSAIAQEDQQMVLLFEGPQRSRMGILMSSATRLEAISPDTVERVGDQMVVQYRNSILPLIELHRMYPTQHEPERDQLSVVVVNLSSTCRVGLIVDRIVDIVEDSLKQTGLPTRPGISYCVSIQGQVTEMLDISAIVTQVNPYLLQQAG